MSNTQEKLAPCPFCGHEAELVGGYGSTMAPFFIRCPNPKCGDGSDWSGFDGPNCMTKEAAVTAWNRRAPTPSLREALDRKYHFHDNADDLLRDVIEFQELMRGKQHNTVISLRELRSALSPHPRSQEGA